MAETTTTSPSTAAGDLEALLNTAQRTAVTAGDGAQLVIAGPGSGKTRTLIFRVAHLVGKGVPPESILLLTFTRRAAQEMLRRASGLLDERCSRVAGGTFHAFANQVLRRYAQLLGYGSNFTILDRSDAGDLVGVLRSELGFDQRGRRFPRKESLLDLYSRRINTGRTLEQLVAESYPQFLDDLGDIAQLEARYGERKKEQNVMDYDDLLLNLRALLQQHDAARRTLSATYRHVLVDEYQDTNRLQAHIAALLASSHGNLMVVGDDAQSIYAFRGASFRNILDFPKVFPGCRQTLLEHNYRSTQPILDLANGLLAQAREKFDKRLFCEIEGDRRPVLVRAADEYDQAAFVRQRILELREEGVPLSAIAVLCRAAWHSNVLELELRNANLPFQKFGGLKFVEASHVKDVTALLRLSCNPTDTAAWFRFLQLLPGVGPRTAQRLGQRVAEEGGDLSSLTEPKVARTRYGPELARLVPVIGEIADVRRTLPERVETAVEHAKPLLASKYDDYLRRLRDLDTLPAMAERYSDLDTLLTDLAIDPPEIARPGVPDPDDECLTLSTVHSAKGLEWQAVFVLQLCEGQFPSYNSLQDAEAMEEERRLLYVAITRAQRHLYLLYPEQAGRRPQLSELCSFLGDLPDLSALVEETVFAPHAQRWGLPANDTGGASPNELLARINDYFAGD